MAVVIPLKGGRTLSGALNYAEKNKETGEKNLTRGVNCSDDKKTALAEMRATKQMWNGADGRQYKGYVISFTTDEVTPDQALDHAENWCKESFPTNESFLGCHVDTDNIHIHIIVNSVDFEDGHKLHLAKYELENLREISDKICREMGLSVIEPKTIDLPEGTIRTKSRQEYEVLKNAIEKNDGSSYKLNLCNDIKSALENTAGQGYKEFKAELNRHGIDFKLSGDKKPNIAFRYKDAPEKVRFVRGDNLAKTFSNSMFTRENIEKILQKDLIPRMSEAENKYIHFAINQKMGSNNKTIAKAMLKSGIDSKSVIKTIATISPNQPSRSDDARDWATKIVKDATKDIKSTSNTKGGGMATGRGGGSNRSAPTIDRDKNISAGGLTINVLVGKDIDEIARNIAYSRGCTIDEAKSLMGIEEQ